MNAWGLTDPGMVRSQNQDTFILQHLSDTDLLAVVCDGMGGARSGNVASQMALEVFTASVQELWKEQTSVEEIFALLQHSADEANRRVYEQSGLGEEYRGMGTTLVAALIRKSTAYIVNVGDSRAYHAGKHGISLITRDHSLIQMMVQRGELTWEEAREHPGKHLITRAVGTEQKVESDVYQVDLEQGDSILLCSDGLSNVLADQEILFEIAHGESKDDCCQRLLAIAQNRGAPDNVTVVLVSL